MPGASLWSHPDGLTATEYAARPAIGLNLDFHKNGSPSILFADAFRQSLPWIAYSVNDPGEFNSGADVSLTPEGWPLEIPFTENGEAHRVHTLMFNGLNGEYPRGHYTLRFRGRGRLIVTGDAEHTDITVNVGDPALTERSILVSPSNEGIYLTILESPNDPLHRIRDIEFLLPGCPSNAAHPFNPAFLEFHRPFSVLRTSQIMETNGFAYGCDAGTSPAAATCRRSWTGRPQMHEANQAGDRGVAIEYLIALVNELDCDLWLNVPHGADDGYLEGLGQLLAANLERERTLFFELSSEAWNFSGEFPQFDHYIAAGAAASLDQSGATGTGSAMLGANALETGRKFFAYKWAEACHELEQALDPVGIRLVKVLPSFSESILEYQGQSVDVTNSLLLALQDPRINPHQIQPDAVAVAAYLGIPYAFWAEQALENAADFSEEILIREQFTGESLVQMMRDNITNPLTDPFGSSLDEAVSIPQILNIQQTRIAAHTRSSGNSSGWLNSNIPVIAYEGGQHLAFYNENNVDPGLAAAMESAHTRLSMEQFFQELIAQWFAENGGLFVSYTNLSLFRSYGHFGIASSLYHNLSESPKYRGHLRAWSDLNFQGNVSARALIPPQNSPNTMPLTIYTGLNPVALIERHATDQGVETEFSNDLNHWQRLQFDYAKQRAVVPYHGNLFLRFRR
ncbi:MAG: hypothetical protein AAGA96_01920 [Verrucomicrobiota bacterium]